MTDHASNIAYAADTIVAAATPPGAGGVAIVRLSGSDAATIALRLSGPLPEARVAGLRTFCDVTGEPIDHGLVLFFPGPGSFTGEDVVELHAHGGPVIVAAIVAAAVDAGARRAEPGEFSRRAFLNDKLDLAQAEGIADLIASGTRQAARAALRTLTGAFSVAVDELLEQLIRLRLHVEAAIDFPEEEIDFLDDDALRSRIDTVAGAFDRLLERAEAGRALRDGIQAVIVGRPNAGKSSLLNYLSGQDAAIVTEVAGTTRDILRERIDLDGLLVELVDTAGLREDPDVIEAEGIRRAHAALKAADIILWVTDATTAEREDRPPEALPDGVPVLHLYNKCDLARAVQPADGGIPVSAKSGEGIPFLRERLRELAGVADAGEGSFTARQRHVDALRRARQHFDAGVTALRKQRAGELLAEELRLAQEALGEITGSFTSDDLLGRIFSEFCIGK